MQSSFAQKVDNSIDPRSIALIGQQQYTDHDRWNNAGSACQSVPMSFDENAPIHWCPVWSHTRQMRKWLPTSLLYYAFSSQPDRLFFGEDCNVYAASSSLEDAILQGFLEYIEQDSFAIWWYIRSQRPGVDLDSLQVLCITEDIVFGIDAHLNERVGINRALTELSQFLPVVLNQYVNNMTIFDCQVAVALNWWKTATVANQPCLLPGTSSACLTPAFKHSPVDVSISSITFFL